MEYYNDDDDNNNKDFISLIIPDTTSAEELLEHEIETTQIKLDNYNKIMQEYKSDIDIFLVWSENNYMKQNYFNLFEKNFSTEYRINLYEIIHDHFDDEKLISDTLLWYFKLLIINALQQKKKYDYLFKDGDKNEEEESLSIDYENNQTNMKIVVDKHAFKCFVDNSLVCYFKENGVNYYAS